MYKGLYTQCVWQWQ